MSLDRWCVGFGRLPHAADELTEVGDRGTRLCPGCFWTWARSDESRLEVGDD